MRIRNRTSALIILTAFLIVGTTGCTEVASVVTGEVLLDSPKIEAEIEREASRQLGSRITVECPDSMSAPVGGTRQCVARDEFGGTSLVDVTVQNREGYITWQVR
jgi:hypothetical protein